MRDCDVIHISDHMWLGAADALFTAVSPNGSGDAEHRDYLFENIRFDTSGALLAVNLPGATLRNFRFKNISLPAGVNQSFLRGSADGISFENIRVSEKPALEMGAIKLKTEGEMRGIKIGAP